MITEEDFGKQIYYIDGEELKGFLASDRTACQGVGYEWEGEGVTHLHLTPVLHAFGRQHKVSFAKAGAEHAADATIRVDVAADGSATVGDVKVSEIPARENLYSRNKGLIELDVLADKRVLVIGLGSGGSSIALQLAKAGVGQFALMDFDRVELHNLSRHTCSLNELGRLKTDALYDAIKGKNPYAIVDKFPIDINKNLNILAEEIRKADVVLCCTDNNMSRFNISNLLKENQRIGIFGRAITRAEGGDVFIYRPGQACYGCLVGSSWFDIRNEEITDLESAKRAGRLPAYVSEEDAETIVQVGLGTDIEPINNMMAKLALVELSRGAKSGISSLEEEFTANYYIWANRREHQYARWGRFDNTDGMPTIMRWYGITMSKSDDCAVCGKPQKLNVDENLMESLRSMGSDDLSDLSLSDDLTL